MAATHMEAYAAAWKLRPCDNLPRAARVLLDPDRCFV